MALYRNSGSGDGEKYAESMYGSTLTDSPTITLTHNQNTIYYAVSLSKSYGWYTHSDVYIDGEKRTKDFSIIAGKDYGSAGLGMTILKLTGNFPSGTVIKVTGNEYVFSVVAVMEEV